jgi:hypothetical protein
MATPGRAHGISSRDGACPRQHGARTITNMNPRPAVPRQLDSHITGRRARHLIGWFAYETFALPPRFDLVGKLTLLCRLAGIGAAFLLLLLLQTYHPASLSAGAWWLLCLALTLPASALAREVAFVVAATLANYYGRDFTRSGPLPGGGMYCESMYSDLRWARCEMRPASTMYRWRDAEGMEGRRVIAASAASTLRRVGR